MVILPTFPLQNRPLKSPPRLGFNWRKQTRCNQRFFLFVGLLYFTSFMVFLSSFVARNFIWRILTICWEISQFSEIIEFICIGNSREINVKWIKNLGKCYRWRKLTWRCIFLTNKIVKQMEVFRIQLSCFFILVSVS